MTNAQANNMTLTRMYHQPFLGNVVLVGWVYYYAYSVVHLLFKTEWRVRTVTMGIPPLHLDFYARV